MTSAFEQLADHSLLFLLQHARGRARHLFRRRPREPHRCDSRWLDLFDSLHPSRRAKTGVETVLDVNSASDKLYPRVRARSREPTRVRAKSRVLWTRARAPRESFRNFQTRARRHTSAHARHARETRCRATTEARCGRKTSFRPPVRAPPPSRATPPRLDPALGCPRRPRASVTSVARSMRWIEWW